MVVSEIMTSDPVAIDVRQELREAMLAMADLDVRHLPVIEDGQLVGILSDRDLAPLRQRAADASARLPELAAIMSADVVSVNPESEVSEVIELMLEQSIGAVPVVSADSLELVGIVSYVDVLRSHAELLD